MRRQSDIEATKRYNKKYLKKYQFCLNKRTDAEMIEFLDGQENKTGLIKKLLKKEMNRSE